MEVIFDKFRVMNLKGHSDSWLLVPEEAEGALIGEKSMLDQHWKIGKQKILKYLGNENDHSYIEQTTFYGYAK